MRRLPVFCLIALVLCWMTPCSATLVKVGGSAGDSLATAADLTGTHPTEIVGSLDGYNANAVAVFKILNLQPTLFSAYTTPVYFGVQDTVLSLFDSTGHGIYMNDDAFGGTYSCLPSQANNPCSTTAGVLPAGVYYLAISRSANFATDASGNEIFDILSYGSTDLIGAINSNPLGGWDGGASNGPDYDLVKYEIVLAGTVPEPCTWLLMIGGGALVGLLRRRRQ